LEIVGHRQHWNVPQNRLCLRQHIFQERHSMLHLPVRVGDDLRISIERGTTRISPREALSIAEKLIRTCTRRMILEEQADIARQQARE
jgi:hypothetical protein